MSYKILPTLEIKHTKRINYFMNQFIVARFIENKFSQKECLQFNFSSFNFLENRKGLSEVSQSLFKKDVEDLKPMEMVEILALYEAPLRYNRSRNPQKAKERTEHFYHVYLNNSKIKN
ncbi:transglycosylase domain-containing protein [Chryseobacterium gambrini]|uniref:transglycosylase domain-containing protein n=1 Tax=Chryseobacterium gambrini TaxID=373672 RepID=UPI0025B32EC9|nr:transglycosylase domain-containing protein [Chryseobacterium gambrini]MDN4031486.1 transglycosylase domain-containing protein [Chryseobacterium gambrini]